MLFRLSHPESLLHTSFAMGHYAGPEEPPAWNRAKWQLAIRSSCYEISFPLCTRAGVATFSYRKREREKEH